MKTRPEIPASQTGAALLSILLLVAILSVVAATTLDRVILSTQLAQNGQDARQARLLSYAAEDLALARIADLRANNATQTTLAASLLDQPQSFTLPGGRIVAMVADSGNCFNLNSLVTLQNDIGIANPQGMDQFVSLMVAMAIPENTARSVAASAADWADSDVVPQPGGAEDGAYQSKAVPHTTPNRLFAHKSELRAVAGVTPALYAKLEPVICALPVTDLSPINVNTLAPGRSELLAMLWPTGIANRSSLQAYLAKRPQGGYGSLIKFWDGLKSGAGAPQQAAQDQVKLVTNWFALDLQIESGDIRLRELALIAADKAPPRILWRSWSEPQ